MKVLDLSAKIFAVVFCLLGSTACNDASRKAPDTKTTSAAAPAPATTSNTITVKGSDTMVVLGQRWAESYMKASPAITIQVTGGGSGTGIAALLNGTTTLANSSRPIKAEEKQKAKDQGKDIQEHKVAFDGLAVVVNKASPIQQLTLQQIMGIYTGHFNNWKEVGGPDQKILRYCREANSGTYVFFKEQVLTDKDYAPDCQTMPGTGAVAEAVAKDPNGIGYGGVSYFENRPELKILSIKKDDASEAISPVTADGKVNSLQIRNLQYPISRNLYIYVLGTQTPEIKGYLDWILSDAGQKVVAEVGYVPLKDIGAATASTEPK